MRTQPLGVSFDTEGTTPTRGTAATGAQAVTVLAKGLDNPRGLEVAATGAIYVSEAGTAGERCAKVDGQENCFGFSGAITRIKNGKQRRVASGFLSLGGKDGSFTVGVDDVAVARSGVLYAIMTAAPLENPRAMLGREGARQFGKLLRVAAGRKEVVADVAKVELETNPDRTDVNPNPYGVALVGTTPYVVDAGGNTLLRVSAGRARVIAVLPQQRIGARKVQSVPTSIAAAADGTLYIGELGGEAPRRARIFKVEPGKKPVVYAKGFTNVVGVAVDADENVYVGQLVNDFAKTEKGVFMGSLFKIAPDGTRRELAKGRLSAIGGVAVARNGDVYVSTNSIFPGRGQVVRVEQ